MVRLKQRTLAGGLAVMLLVAVLSAMAVGAAYGENATDVTYVVDTTKQGSIDVGVPEGMDHMREAEIQVDGYFVAAFDKNGLLTATANFESLKDKLAEYSEKRDTDTAEALALEAEKVALSLSSNPDKQTTVIDGGGRIEGLTSGLYLLLSRAEGYTFSPLLVPVPYAVKTGEADDDPSTGSYELLYTNISAELKGEQNTPDEPNPPRFGSLEIVKSLPFMDTTLGNPTFVFRITAVDANGVTVYNDVKTISFTEAGQKSIQLNDIFPVDSTITVTEVYSGASYVVTADATQTVTISADALQQQMTFENKPNDDRKGGTGIENSFTKGADGWQLTQRTAESEEAA